MDRKIVLAVSAASLIAVAVAILMPGGRAPDRQPKLPWMVARNGADQVEVFGLTLGHSTLGEALALFQEKPETNLFRSPQGDYAIESYFQRLNLSGLRGNFVLTLAVDEAVAADIYGRGLRTSKMGNGTQKVELSEADLARIRQTPIAHLTYIPGADLEEQLIESRFGQPQRRLAEPGGIVHWLYPDKGLDIAVNPQGKEVMQYFNRADFARVLAPLEPPKAGG